MNTLSSWHLTLSKVISVNQLHMINNHLASYKHPLPNNEGSSRNTDISILDINL